MPLQSQLYVGEYMGSGTGKSGTGGGKRRDIGQLGPACEQRDRGTLAHCTARWGDPSEDGAPMPSLRAATLALG